MKKNVPVSWAFSLIFWLLLAGTTLLAQVPSKRGDKSLGGTADDEGRVILKLPDGGYLVGGDSNSPANGGDKTAGTNGRVDFWVVRYDANHNKQWDKNFGGVSNEELTAITATADGGFLLGGASNSPSAEGLKTGEHYGGFDYWIVKIKANGDYQWDQSYGGTSNDYLTTITALSDGTGYLVGGYSTSPASGTKEAEQLGTFDTWVIRIDTNGLKEWDKTYGGDQREELHGILPTSDGHYLLASQSSSPAGTGKEAANLGGADYWLVKINASGGILWDKTLGGTAGDYLRSIVPTVDGGYFLSGFSDSDISGTKTGGNLGGYDYWIVRVDSDGDPIWDKTVGGSDSDEGIKAVATADGGVVVAGNSSSNTGGTKSADSKGGSDYWIVSIDREGKVIWDKTLGTTGLEQVFDFTQLISGDYVVVGFSQDVKDEDKESQPHGGNDYWLVTLEGCIPPTLTFVSNLTNQLILQNTPGVSLSISGCSGGTLHWNGPNGITGTSSTISVPTSITGTLAYSATCTIGGCSASQSTTLTVAPPPVTGSFDGFINGADCGSFRGWAWERSKPNSAVSIDILDGPNVIATVLADVFRQDLQTAGKGNGKHAFSWSIPANLKDGLAHSLSARVTGSSFILKDSPKALICEGAPVPGGNNPPIPPSPTILIAPLAAQVGVPFSGTLSAFTDPEGQPLTYKLSGLPGGLLINQTTRVISGTPSEAGTFVLTYQATDPGPLTNSVSFPLTVNPASTTTVTGSFEGYLDKVECGTIRGWVWDRNKPNTPVTVEIYSKTPEGTETVWGSTVANIYREDLKNAGKGNGVHAYSFSTPAGLKDGQTRLLYGRVQGSTYLLKDSGKPLTCNSPVRASAETGSDLKVTLLENPVTDQVKVEIRGAAGRPVHAQLTDFQGHTIGFQTIGSAGTVEFVSFGIRPQAAGLLLLQISSEQQRRVIKVVKP
ncbi:hypothetical protein GCM10027299_26670 [Larkinella ripae]